MISDNEILINVYVAVNKELKNYAVPDTLVNRRNIIEKFRNTLVSMWVGGLDDKTHLRVLNSELVKLNRLLNKEN